jgi:cytochrome c-type biogenesis protein CcmF
LTPLKNSAPEKPPNRNQIRQSKSQNRGTSVDLLIGVFIFGGLSMTVLAFWVTVMAFLASLAATFNYYRNAYKRKFVLFPARVWVKWSVGSILVASALLLIQIFQHDFSNGYVYSYSDRSLPYHFLLSSFYAGQEGSFLFWALCSSLIALWLAPYSGRRKSEPSVMGAFMAVQSLLLLLLIAKSPFKYVWEMIPNAPINEIPADGHGLNPLLQNFWMVIHPPVLFIGFAAMAVPFSFAIAGLWRKEYQEWVSQAFPWILFASCSLGLGLMLGAYWAYGVLGWGGYWGWDPVENSSLVPWITSVALIHTLLVQRRSQKFVRTNFALAIVSFFLVVYSTFLTRSGILGDSSVHSFTDPGATVYWMLVGFLAFILLLGFGLMFVRRKDLAAHAGAEASVVSRETALGAGTIVLLLSAAVILFGTSLPIVSKTTVEPSFYDATNLPIAIAIGLLIGFSLFIQWGVDDLKSIAKRSLWSLGASITVVVALWFVGVREWLTVLFILASAFAFFVNVEIGLRTMKGNIVLLGGKFAHLGIAVMFLGIIATGKFGKTQHLSLELNTPQEALGYTMTYVGYQPTQDNKFAFNIAVEKEGRKFQLAPVMFQSGDQGMMRNPDIISFLTKDFYVSPVALEQPTEHAAHEGHDQEGQLYTIPKGQTVSFGKVKATFVKFDMNAHDNDAMTSGKGGMAIGSVLELSDGDKRETVTPVARYSASGEPTYSSSHSQLINSTIQLVSMQVGMGGEKPSTITVKINNGQTTSPVPEALVVEASTKPYISLLWVGTVIMIGGFLLSIVKRKKEA